ncbi:hypothetical protein COE03_31205 [Bacillus thuringiensis]|nr:hypothetical protein COE03_31205 [Bacillus thuringiensis]
MVSSTANFSGEMNIDAKITNFDKYQGDIGYIPGQEPDLYQLYKDTINKIPLPAGVTLDDTNHTVKFNRSLSFAGVGGHLTAAEATQVKIESLDKNKKTVLMSLQDYQNPTIREQILKQNQ